MTKYNINYKINSDSVDSIASVKSVSKNDIEWILRKFHVVGAYIREIEEVKKE